MFWINSFIALLLLVFFCIFMVVFGGILILASLGKTLGLRKRYVEFLLAIFEYGREKIEKAERKTRLLDRSMSLEGDVDATSINNRCSSPSFLSSSDDEICSTNKKTLENGSLTNNSVISREGLLLVPDPNRHTDSSSSPSTIHKIQSNDLKKGFDLSDSLDYIKAGVEAIIDDEVTKRFSAEELPSWNLLTRTNKNYHYISMRLTVLWFIGFFFRYCVLFPFRLLLTIVGIGSLVVSTAVIGYLPNGRFKQRIYWHVSLMCFRILSRALSAIITYHNRENRAKPGGICVANHTSPIDVVILACDNCYALVGQSHEGFLGLVQRALARATSHIWFERSEVRDRTAVARRLSKHVEDKEKLPILIFPEGTCINNTSVMMFKKGSFEVGGIIYPVAIKYDPKFGDAFWNSSQQGMIHYLARMMTSWAIVCEVWYLPPMTKLEDEDAVTFANRVKSEIANQGGLVDLMWDGQLKRAPAKQEWRERQQQEYSKRIKVE